MRWGRLWMAVAVVLGFLSGSSAVAQSSIQYVYDDLGRLVGVVDPTGDTAVYHYDAVGNLLSIDRYASSQVSIIGFSPTSGPAGISVRIFGTGFSATPAEDGVTFNGTAAAVSAATSTQLTVTVPAGATTGAIGVTAPGGSATSATAFTVAADQAPTITSFTPSIGTAGASTTITGTNFDTRATYDRTALNVTLAAVSSATATTLGTVVPEETGSGPISVATAFGTAVSATDLFIPPAPYGASDVAFTQRMTIGSGQTVTINTAGKIGLVTFAGTQGQRVFVNGTQGMSGHVVGCDVWVSLLDVHNDAVASPACMESSGYLDTAALRATGTYTLLVAPTSPATGSVTLTLYDVPVDVTDPIVAGGSPVTVTTTTPGQNARLTFSGTAGQRVAIKGTNGMSGHIVGCDVNVSLLGPDASTVVAPTCMESSGFIDVTTLPTTGTYTILVDPVSFTTGSLTLALYDVPADVTDTITPGGSPVTVTTTTPGQNATLTFSGTAGQRISLRGTNGMSGQIIGCDVNVSMRKPDGTTLASPTCMEISGFIDVTTLPTTGTYTILVDPVSFATGNLTLTLYDVPADPSTSVAINGSPATLTTTTPGQNGTVAFSGTAAQVVTVHLTGNTMSTTTVKLLNPDGTTLTSTISGLSGFNLPQKTLPTTGTYTIVIDPSSANTGSITVNVTSP